MKVLIVDDEMIVRVNMKSIIDWQQYDFELVGDAANGKEALEKIRTSYPEIVITDIKMPTMDGIELIEKAKKISKPMKFIVLSNYNEFDIVKEAMKSGAEDYILKYKMCSEQLLKILQNVRNRIEEEKKDLKKEKQINYQLQKNLPELQKRLLADIIHYDSISEWEYKRGKDFLKLNFDLSSICCMAIKIRDFHELELLEEKDIALVNTSIVNIAEEIIMDNFKGYCIETKFGEFCIVLSIDKQMNESHIRDKLAETGNRLNEMLYTYLNIKFIIGTGPISHGVDGLRNSYRQAKAMVDDETGSAGSNTNLLVLKAKEYIDNNFTRDLSTQEVADSVNLSRSYFCMLFSEYMNMGCSDYITKVRIQKAKNLLKDTDYKVYEIAEKIGYDSCQYFSRVFKKVSGLTPLGYRTKVQ